MSYGEAGCILKLLAAKHSDDVFVPECKDGPSQHCGHVRMDAWTMNKSWTNPCATAYEIKVSRSDFLKDDKWPLYLPYCNAFYFVTPTGLIDISEVPPDAGWLIASKNYARLFTKKKAPYRQVEIPDTLWRYILMCRVAVHDEYLKQDRSTYWREWLVEKSEDQELGRNVSRRIQQLVSERITAVKEENRRLKQVNEGLAEVKTLCEKMDINPKSLWHIELTFDRALARIRGGDLLPNIAQTIKTLEQAQELLSQ